MGEPTGGYSSNVNVTRNLVADDSDVAVCDCVVCLVDEEEVTDLVSFELETAYRCKILLKIQVLEN